MINKTRLLFAAALALGALTIAAGSASAAEVAVSPAENVNAVSSGKVTFTTELANIACNLTLALDLNANIEKTAGRSVGTADRVSWRECTGGNVNAVLNLPWAIEYVGINGTLPSGVTSVRMNLVGTQFRFGIFFELVNCLYEGEVGNTLGVSLVRGSENRYTTGSLVPNEAQNISYVSGPGSCPASGSMNGTFTLSTTQTLTRN